MKDIPTQAQLDKIEELKSKGYTWDIKTSQSAAGVVFTKGKDLWFFGLAGEIMENPEGITIQPKSYTYVGARRIRE